MERPERPDSEPCSVCGGPTPGSHSQLCDGCMMGSAESQEEKSFYETLTRGE